MKSRPFLSPVFFALLLPLLTACDQKPTPLKEGVIWEVVWVQDETGKTGYYRYKLDDIPRGVNSARYNQDMYGLLFPNHLELRFAGNPDSHALIVPFNRILSLEFGDKGHDVTNQ